LSEATRSGRPIADFSGLRWSAAGFHEVAPRTADELCRIVSAACARGMPVRTRAQGHSLNGSTLPAAGELLVRTADLREVRFASPGSVTAGCGTVLWVLQSVLRAHGFDLPVLNDGYPGPTVGGYLAAGGFGPKSDLHGGFWDNVAGLTFVDGGGRLRRVARDDALFPWLFGSMGQLGIFAEATLAIVPLEGAAQYPEGKALVAPRLAEQHVPLQFAPRGDERLFWFTLFVPDEELAVAQRELLALEARHGGALRFAERYCYPVRHRGMVAPLVYPEARPFTATGAWGWLGDASREAVEKLLAFDRGFMALAMSRPGYRRYIQSELPAGPQIYEQCFGPAIYAELRRIKSELDPGYLLNRGSVFAR
jgi:FAD/FMN-containing dehydrogenase